MSKKAQAKNSAKSKEKKILEVIMAYARLDFSHKTEIGSDGDIFDAIGAGVNMLGEELKSSTISLKEKEQLLREIHHRVKNNLQIISSLLSLQTHNIKDKKFLALIRESRNRIKSMALVHEMLYTTPNLSEVKLKSYVQTLCANIYESYRKPGAVIDFTYSICDEANFEIDRMIPLGLIVNEIVSNSLKHAFNKNLGKIEIGFTCAKGKKQNIIVIKDNGCGLPKGFKPGRDGNLGMQLIFMLGEQINAKVSVESKKGTAYKIQF